MSVFKVFVERSGTRRGTEGVVRCFDKRVIILDKGSVVSDGGAIIREAATSHINPMSEISNEYVVPPEEDYSAYSGITEASEETPVEVLGEEFIMAGGDE